MSDETGMARCFAVGDHLHSTEHSRHHCPAIQPDLMPYLRDDLKMGSKTRAWLQVNHNRQVNQRLLATIDELYAHIETLNETNHGDAEAYQASLEKVRAESERHRVNASELRAEKMRMQLTVHNRSGLPTDVQELQEEVAAWKDEYAASRHANGILRSQIEGLRMALDKADRKMRKLRKERNEMKMLARAAGEMIVRMQDESGEK